MQPTSFTGKQQDAGTGLQYFNARYYDPSLGRFLSEDPVMQGNNWYAYCGNNPIGRFDPNGREWRRRWAFGTTFTLVDPATYGGNSLHHGEDWVWYNPNGEIGDSMNQDILSPVDGYVVRAQWDDRMGNYILIQTADGGYVSIQHCSQLFIKKDKFISEGDLIAKSGDTGSSCMGAHVHVDKYFINSNLVPAGEMTVKKDWGYGTIYYVDPADLPSFADFAEPESTPNQMPVPTPAPAPDYPVE